MSDEQKPQTGGLGNLLRNLENGMKRLGGEIAPARTEPNVDDAAIAGAAKAADHTPAGENGAHKDDQLDDDLLEVVDTSGPGEEADEGKPQTIKERLQALTLVQKLLLAVVLVVGVMALKNQQESTEITPPAPASSEATPGSRDPMQGQETDAIGGFESSAGELSSGAPHASGSTDPQIDFGDDQALQESPGYTPPGEEHPLRTLDDETAAPPAADAKAGSVPPEFAANPHQPDAVAGADQQAGQQHPALPMGEEPSPFESAEQPAFGEANLGGTPPAAVDSSAQAPQALKPAGAVQPQVDPQVALLEKTIKDQGDRIRQLEELLAKQPAQGTATQKPVHATAAQAAPKVYASKPKQRARPKLCVSSVAAPARNCTTCVAHAVVTSNGAETMIGNGGSIDGFRVSIVGDTVSLQGEDGTQPHQFWPSTTGCSR